MQIILQHRLGQNGCWNNCWPQPTAESCLPGWLVIAAALGRRLSFPYLLRHVRVGRRWWAHAGSLPQDLAVFLQPAGIFTLRNGFALWRPSLNANISAETVAVHLWSAHWLEELVTTSAAVNWRSYRIVESLRLEKASKIIKSNCQPITTVPAKPCPEVPHLHVFWRPPGMVTPPLPWAACSNAWPLFQ